MEKFVRLTRVLHDDIALLVLVVSQRQEDDVALVDPHLLPQLAADMGEAARAVEALGFQAPVTQHLDDLGVFLALLFEDEFALFVVVLVLTPTSVLATLRSVSVWPLIVVLSGQPSPSLFATGEVWRGCPSKRRTFPLFFGILSGG
jgi:hypothetical protein